MSGANVMNGKLVLFDCDGTLVDSHAFIAQSMLATLAEMGLPHPPADIWAEFPALSLRGFLQRMEGHLTGEQIIEANERMLARITSARENGAAQERMFEGIAPALQSLKEQGYWLGIVTNKHGRGLELVLKANGIHDLFVTHNHIDNAPPKPAPNMVLNGMRDVGVIAADCLVVGDSVLDVLAARNAGAQALGVTWAGRDADEMREAGACEVIADVAELLPAIKRWSGL